MNKAVISRAACLALAAFSAHAQTVGAGARAMVNSETLPVYATMSQSGDIRFMLRRGDTVTIGLVLFGDDVTWCAVSKVGETKRLGYASCEFLEPATGATAPAAAAPPASVPPQPAPAPLKPIRIRELAAPPIVVHEVTTAAVPQPAPSPAVSQPVVAQEAAPAAVPQPTPPPAPVEPPKPVTTREAASPAATAQDAAPAAVSQPAPVEPPKPVTTREVAPPSVAAQEAAPAAVPPPASITTREVAPLSVAALEPAPAAVPQPAPPPAPVDPPKPVMTREVAPLPAAVHEAAPAAVPQPAPSPVPVDPPKPVTTREVASLPAAIHEAAPAAVPQPAPAPPPVEPPKPVTTREVASLPAAIHEAAPAAVPQPAPSPAPVEAPKSIPPPEAAPSPIPSSPPVAPSAGGQSDFVEVLLDGSGLRYSLANYTQNTHLLTFLDKGRLAEIDIPALEGVLSEQFQPGALYVAIGGQVRKNYSLEPLAAVTEWLRSPVTSQLAALERRALLPEAREELVAFAGRLSASPPSQSRLLLIHRLYESLRTCDMEVETTIALVHTIAQAIGPALPKEKRYSAIELDRALGAVKSRYRSIMKNARIVRYLFAYQSATDDEVEHYVSFLESDAGKWLISLVDKGFYDATETISRGLMSEIPRRVKSRRHLPGENTAKGLLP